ncbi:MAG: hypothetical protein HPY71_14995 [Firmicutes bacterium]|nr:hypothetical protein [Bacillota bacterium]
MLTHNDQTVPNALEVFEECKDAPVEYWGFKDVGLPIDKMKELIKAMKDAGKTTCLEVVRYTETECLESARLALECGFDYLMGTIFYSSVNDLLKNRPIRYTPFCGRVSGSPSVLEGSILEIIDDAKRIATYGVDGFDLLAYRYVGDPEELTREFIAEVNTKVIMAGSIASFDRLDRVKELNPWAFTIGSAFFTNKFGKDTSIREQIEKVVEYLNR